MTSASLAVRGKYADFLLSVVEMSSVTGSPG